MGADVGRQQAHPLSCAERVRLRRLAGAGDPAEPPVPLLRDVARDIAACCGHSLFKAHRWPGLDPLYADCPLDTHDVVIPRCKLYRAAEHTTGMLGFVVVGADHDQIGQRTHLLSQICSGEQHFRNACSRFSC